MKTAATRWQPGSDGEITKDRLNTDHCRVSPRSFQSERRARFARGLTDEIFRDAHAYHREQYDGFIDRPPAHINTVRQDDLIVFHRRAERERRKLVASA